MPKFYMGFTPARRRTTRAQKRSAFQSGYRRTTRQTTRTGYQVFHHGRTPKFRLWGW